MAYITLCKHKNLMEGELAALEPVSVVNECAPAMHCAHG